MATLLPDVPRFFCAALPHPRLTGQRCVLDEQESRHAKRVLRLSAGAAIELFDALDHWEDVLSRQRFTCGNVFTEADICLFVTLFRFDPVYHGHFKCNVRRIVDYPNLWGFVRDVYQLPRVAQTCNLRHIKEHYYQSHPTVNPSRIVPIGPAIDYDAPHDRARFGGGLQPATTP